MIKKLILWVLTATCFLGIFIFSSQTATGSSKVSTFVTEIIAEELMLIYNLPPSEKEGLIINFHGIIRSFAHAFIFMLLGIFVALLLREYKVKKWYLLAIGICILYAVFDELHQGLFSAGRSCEFVDLLKDWSGSIVGIAAVVLFSKNKSKLPK